MDWLQHVWGVASTVMLFFIARAIKTPKDVERASLLTHLAQEIATVVVMLMPNADWAKLVQEIVARLSAVSATPTRNAAALERAAQAALARLGKTPA